MLVVNDKNIVEYRPVELGTAHDGRRVVKGGLAKGEWFVLNGLQRAGQALLLSRKRPRMSLATRLAAPT